MTRRHSAILLSTPLVAAMLAATGCEYTGTGPDPLRSRYGDPPAIYALLNGVNGQRTVVRIAFSPYTNNYTVTSPSGFTFLRQSVPGTRTRLGRRSMIPHGGGVDLPDPDEWQFDPWDWPDPIDDIPFPDPPLPDPFEDPWMDDLPLPPLPPDDMDFTDFSSGDLDVLDDGLPLGYGPAEASRLFSAPKAAANATYTVKTRVNVGPSAAGMVVSPDKKTIYVAVGSKADVAVVDRATATVTRRISLPTGSNPYSIAITQDGTRLYVGEFVVATATLYSIDIPSGKATALPTPGSIMSQMLVTPDGTQLWVCNYFSGSVTIFDILTNTYVAQVQIQSPWSVAFNASGTRAYVSGGLAGTEGAVTVVDTATLKTIASIAVGVTPRMIRVTPSGRHAFVTHYDSPFISQIDLLGNKVLRNIPLPDSGGSGLTFKHQ